jgi:hypothetical protein
MTAIAARTIIYVVKGLVVTRTLVRNVMAMAIA